MKKDKLALIILDGVGINEKKPEQNALIQAKTPNLDKLWAGEYSKIEASGKNVGVSDGQMGNSEIGHMTIGAGRIIKQIPTKVKDLLQTGKFKDLNVYKDGLKHIQKNNSNIHIIQLFGPGGVHASYEHLLGFIDLIPGDISVYLHLLGDGRDLVPRSMFGYMKDFLEILENYPNIKISTIGGRYYGMDRDNNWERIQKFYKQMIGDDNITNLSILDYIKKSYDNEIFDEFIEPTSFTGTEKIKDGDLVCFLNFRSDRAKQLTKVFVEENFNEFERKNLKNIEFISMTKYYGEYKGKYFIEDENLDNILGEILEKNNLSQLHLAETEKFAHVTKFFNGGKEVKFKNEKDILVKSPKVKSYDLCPEMSAELIYDEFVKNINNFDFFVINFANGDMVGHTGDMQATIKAIEKLDFILGNIIDISNQNSIKLIITADHGNCEEMGTEENKKTSHTTNPVPLWYISNGKTQKIKEKGGLKDIAPTILDILQIEIVSEMDGISLLSGDVE
ncbi:2,3-bisphosphoglycerate-independent phosphoglycerate mutase [Candidatus Vampirococcus lugosii]|uniref:2,3-bisphosphoglycerate-independent phosphoglycerate mutase n=1 Tax=Candidatus Vampirococcus lugosii TaxID=2789015 RepID=A0ABS5QLI5_9BACT|nr:2,3-bisphosphoglycerate-independent phosphoglycerate mutase [Candidatus Vampirococcus lugosii]